VIADNEERITSRRASSMEGMGEGEWLLAHVTSPPLMYYCGPLRSCHAIGSPGIIMTVTCAARLLSVLVVTTANSRDFSGLRRYALWTWEP